MGVIGCIIGGVLRIDTIKITTDILSLIARIDEFTGAWRTFGTLAPRAQCRYWGNTKNRDNPAAALA